MLSELISWVLNTYLGKYLDNFNPAQLSVALLSGEVELDDLPIRRDALLNLGIPVEILGGSIGKIKLQIPIRQFRTSPWCLIIEKVHCILIPKQYDYCDCCIGKADQNYKSAALDAEDTKNLSELKQAESYYVNSYSSWLNFGATLVTKIIENLEFKISDVCFRYEDKSLDNDCQFAIGLIMQSLTAQSIRSELVDGNMNFKNIELTNLSLFLDSNLLHQKNGNVNHITSEQSASLFYLVKPFSAKGHCCREKPKQDMKVKEVPKITIDLVITNIEFSMSNVQCYEICNSIRRLSILKQIPYLHTKRPTCSVRNNPRLWWQYCSFCCGFEIRNRSEKYKIMQENIKFLKIYQQYLVNPNESISKNDAIFKEYFENSRSLYELLQLRKICFDIVKAKNIISKSRHITTGKGMLFHWFPNWMGWQISPESSKNISDENHFESEILSAIENTLDTENMAISSSSVFIHFKVVLNAGKIFLGTGNSISEVEERVESQLENFVFSIKLHPYYYKLGCSIGSLNLIDKGIQHEPFQCLLQPSRIAVSVDAEGKSPNSERKFSLDPDGLALCNIAFEKKYFELEPEYTLMIASKSMETIYNDETFRWLINFWSHPHYKQKKKKTSIPKTNWKNKVLRTLGNKNFAFVDIEVSMPKIIFLQSIDCDNPDAILVDFGELKLHKKGTIKKEKCSKQTDYLKAQNEHEEEDLYLTPCSTPPASVSSCTSPESQMTHIDLLYRSIENEFEKALYEKIYDKYLLIFENVTIFMSRFTDLTFYKSSFDKNYQFLDIPFMSFQIERRLLKISDQGYPLLNFQFKLPEVGFYLSDKNIQILNVFCRREILPYPADSSTLPSTNFMYNLNATEIDVGFGQINVAIETRNKNFLKLEARNLELNLKQRLEKTFLKFSLQRFKVFNELETDLNRSSQCQYLLHIFDDIGTDVNTKNLNDSGCVNDTPAVLIDMCIDLSPTENNFITTLSIGFWNMDVQANHKVVSELDYILQKLKRIFSTKFQHNALIDKDIHKTTDNNSEMVFFVQCSVETFNLFIGNHCKKIDHSTIIILNTKKTTANIHSSPKFVAAGSIEAVNVFNTSISNDKLILSAGCEAKKNLLFHEDLCALRLKLVCEEIGTTADVQVGFLLYYHSLKFWQCINNFWPEQRESKQFTELAQNTSTNSFILPTIKPLSWQVTFRETFIAIPTLQKSSNILVFDLGIFKISVLNENEEEMLRNILEKRKTFEINVENFNVTSTTFREKCNFFSSYSRNAVEHNITDVILDNISFLLNITTKAKWISRPYKVFPIHMVQVEGSIDNLANVTLSKFAIESVIKAYQNITKTKTNPVRHEKPVNHLINKDTEFTLQVKLNINGLSLDLLNQNKTLFVNITFNGVTLCINNQNNIKSSQISFKTVLVKDKNIPPTGYKLGIGVKFEMETKMKDLKTHFSSSCSDLSSIIDQKEKEIDVVANRLNNSNHIADSLIILNRVVSDDNQYLKYSFDMSSFILTISLEALLSTLNFISELQSKEHMTREGPAKVNPTLCIKYSIRLPYLNICITNKEQHMAQVFINDIRIKLTKYALEFILYGVARSVSIEDLTSYGRIYSQRFLISEQSLFRFSFHREIEASANNEELYNFNDIVRATVNSIYYVHTKRFLSELLQFVNVVNQQKNIYYFNKQQVGKRASSGKIRLSLSAKSSIIGFPIHAFSSDMLIFDFGVISLRNANNNCKSSIGKCFIELQNVNCYICKNSNGSLHEDQTNSNRHIYLGNYVLIPAKGNILNNAYKIQIQYDNDFSENSETNPIVKIAIILGNLDLMLNDQSFKQIKRLFRQNFGEILDSYNVVSSNEQITKGYLIYFCLNNTSIHLSYENCNILSVKFFDAFVKNSYINGLTEFLISCIDVKVETGKTKENVLIHSSSKNIKESQIQICCRETKELRNISININNTRFILYLVLINDILNFLNEANSKYVSTSDHEEDLPRKLKKQEVETKLEVRTENFELVLLENRSLIDGNATILRICGNSSINYSKYKTFSDTSISVFEISTCLLCNEKETKFSIIESFPINCNIIDNSINISITEQVFITLSYIDIKLMIKIISNILFHLNMINNREYFKNDDIKPTLITSEFKEIPCGKPLRENDTEMNEEALCLSKTNANIPNDSTFGLKRLQVKACFVSVYIIDDCIDVNIPLLKSSFRKLNVVQKILVSDSNTKVLEGNANMVMEIDYYNRYLSGWEPFLETWSTEIRWKQKNLFLENIYNLQFFFHTKQQLVLNFSTTFCELLRNVSERWFGDYTKFIKNMGVNLDLPQRSPYQPIIIKNLTGETLVFKLVLTQQQGITRTQFNQKSELSHWIQVSHGEKTAFEFNLKSKLNHNPSSKKYANQLLLDIKGWTTIGPLSVEKVGTFFETITSDDGEKVNIIIEISLIGSAQKLITVRSPYVVVNKFESSVFLKMDNNKNKEIKAVTLINAGLSYNIPLKFIESTLYIKPISNQEELKSYQEFITSSKLDHIFFNIDIENKLTKYGFGFTKTEVSLPLSYTNNRKEMFECKGFGEKSFFLVSEIKKHYINSQDNIFEDFKIRFKAPLKIINLLCCDLTYIINNSIKGCISSSKTAFIHMLNIAESFFLEITIENYKVSGKLRVSLCKHGIFESKLKLTDHRDRALFLRISVHSYDLISYQICITAPIWILNKTSLPLIFRQEGTNRTASGQFEEHERGCQRSPLMASFSDSEGTPSLEVRLGKNNIWSKSFSLQNEYFFRELKSDNSKKCYLIGIKVFRGREYFAFTYFITLTHRYQVWNNTSYSLKFAQKCDTNCIESMEHKVINVKPGTHFPFYWNNCDEERLFCIKSSNIEFCHWSHGIPLKEMQSWFLNIRNDFGEIFLLRIEMLSKGPMCVVIISDANNIPPPIRLDNYSDISINFAQVDSKPNWRSLVRPKSSIAYAFDDPLGKQQLIMEVPGGNSVEMSIENIGASINISYENFKYIVFQNCFDSIEQESNSQQWVVGVKERRVIVTKKKYGDRSQLWLMNSFGNIEHIGSSPPNEKTQTTAKKHFVLDIDGTPRALGVSQLILRPQNKQRVSTQSWRFENGRLMCLRNMCVQALGGNDGIYEGNEVVLGAIQHIKNATSCKTFIPYYQHIEPINFRAGSGCLQISCTMDGPVKCVKIRDIEEIPTPLMLSEPSWNSNLESLNEESRKPKRNNYMIQVDFVKGIATSIVAQYPTEELAYLSVEKCFMELSTNHNALMVEFEISDLQLDNQLLDTPSPVVLKMCSDSSMLRKRKEMNLRIKYLFSDLSNTFIFETVSVDLYPCHIFLDEIFILKLIRFLTTGKRQQYNSHFTKYFEYGETEVKARNSRYYLGNLYISPMQIRLSALTAPKLSKELLFVKNRIGLTLIKFEDAVIDFEKFIDTNNFRTIEIYRNILKEHYINQVKWHAASILGCVDFLGNPLGFASDLSEGISSFIFEGSVKSLVKNVTHGISNSTAKLTESISESLVKIILDEQDNEARQKMLERQSDTSLCHLAAGFKGLGFGLLGGVTSIARHAYLGAQIDGIGGFINGVGKGLIGTVTKPIIGILDLASETASALRESSKSVQNRMSRRRLPRCTNGVPGGLLPVYSYRQSKGQHYLYLINNRDFREKLIFYEPDIYTYKDTKLRMLISNEFVRIFSFHDSMPTVAFECHLSEILSCHPICKTCSVKNIPPNEEITMYFIEISTNLPKITRPRIRCQTEEVSERSATYINYAKIIYEESKRSFAFESSSQMNIF